MSSRRVYPTGRLPVDRAPDRNIDPVMNREGGQSSLLLTIPTPTEAARAAARRNLAVMALNQPDPRAWLADALDALGLREVAHR